MDSWAQEVVGVVSTNIAAVIGALVWIGKLGARVTANERTLAAMNHDIERMQEQVLADIRTVRDDIVRAGNRIAEAREDGVRNFVNRDDFKRLEDKLDEVRGTVARATSNRRTAH